MQCGPGGTQALKPKLYDFNPDCVHWKVLLEGVRGYLHDHLCLREFLSRSEP